MVSWELPTLESRTTNDEYIHHRAKYHCFINKKENNGGTVTPIATSLCNKHRVYIGVHDNIESGEIAMRPEIACKICYNKWKKQFNIHC